MVARGAGRPGRSAGKKVGGHGARFGRDVAAKPESDAPIGVEGFVTAGETATAKGSASLRMETDLTGGDKIGRLLGQRPAARWPQSCEAGCMVGGKLRYAGQTRLALLRSPLPLGGRGPLCPDARCLPEGGNRRGIEGGIEKGHLVELPLEPISEDDRRCSFDRPSGEHRLRVAVDMDIDGVAAPNDCHLMPVVGTETHVGSPITEGKPEGVVGVLAGDEWLCGEAGAERPLSVACTAPLAEPHPGDERRIAVRNLAGKDEPTAGEVNRPVDDVIV